MRLHRDAVGRAQMLEVERRHDARPSRPTRPVAADLDARGRRAHAGWRGGRCSSPATARGAAPRRARRASSRGRASCATRESTASSLRHDPHAPTPPWTQRIAISSRSSLTILACLTWTTSTDAIIELLTEDARRTLSDIGERVAPLGARREAARRPPRVRSASSPATRRVVDHAQARAPARGVHASCASPGTTQVDDIAGVAAGHPRGRRPSTRRPATPTRSCCIRVQRPRRPQARHRPLRRSGRVTGTKTLMVLDVWRRAAL